MVITLLIIIIVGLYIIARQIEHLENRLYDIENLLDSTDHPSLSESDELELS